LGAGSRGMDDAAESEGGVSEGHDPVAFHGKRCRETD
jgi:hypothetical protein